MFVCFFFFVLLLVVVVAMKAPRDAVVVVWGKPYFFSITHAHTL